MLSMIFIYNWNEKTKRCLSKFHLINNIYISSQIIIYYILSLLLMILFSCLTISNIHQRTNRSLHLIVSIQQRRRESQLARILFFQIIVHLILVLPFGIFYGIKVFIPSTETSNIIAINLIFVTWQQCDYFVSFFLYVLSASLYQQELIRILKSFKYFNKNIEQQYSRTRIIQYQELRIITIMI